MIVVDASAVVESLLGMPSAPAVEAVMFASHQTLHAPHLVDVEVAQVVRRMVAHGGVDRERGLAALEQLIDLRVHRYPHYALLPRIWELRNNLTAYDAAYVALAEALNAPLLTRDRRLAAAAGHRAKIELV
ncbi:MAG TPA: type II toxin-antitoxin system VapC family toxin [Rhizomicrobium sp.]|nr:type II toxin-antitoxin system VapC family toxin [Rhizomicrobium sp.]